jgi:hypothetical protein
MKAIRNLYRRVFGYRYYAVIIGIQGSGIYEVASQIHRTKKSAEEHRQRIYGTRTYIYIETIKFRSRNDYRITRDA